MITARWGQAFGGEAAALVLDGHSRAGVEFLQSLGRGGIAVDLSANGECRAWRSCYCRQRVQQPDSTDGQAFLNWLEALFEANKYSLVVPSTEASLRCLLLLPDSHAIRRAAVLPSTKSLEIAFSKHLTWNLAQSLGIPVPASRLITSKDALGEPEMFPVVLKPIVSLVEADGQLVGLTPTIVRTRAEWPRALDRLLALCPVLEQEYITGHGVGIECLYRDGERLWFFQHERLHELPLTGGGSSYRRASPVDDALLKAATSLLDRLEWHGIAMVEFRGTAEQGYRLMEINPRAWGSLALPINAGVDFPKGLWCLAMDQDPGPQPRYRLPYYTRNLELDFDWLKENLRADHFDALLLTRPKLMSLLEYGRIILGVESWDHFDARDWRVWIDVLRNTINSGWRTVKSMLIRALRPYLLFRRHRKLLSRPIGHTGYRAQRILFVCYGNICRSPLAELYAKKLAPNLEVASAGFHDTVGRVAPKWYQAISAGLGIDLSASQSRRIDTAQVEWAELIVLADMDNLDRLEHEFPNAVGKTTMLGLFLPTPRAVIEDPYHLDATRAGAVAQDVMAAVRGVTAWACAQPGG